MIRICRESKCVQNRTIVSVESAEGAIPEVCAVCLKMRYRSNSAAVAARKLPYWTIGGLFFLLLLAFELTLHPFQNTYGALFGPSKDMANSALIGSFSLSADCVGLSRILISSVKEDGTVELRTVGLKFEGEKPDVGKYNEEQSILSFGKYRFRVLMQSSKSVTLSPVNSGECPKYTK